MECFYSGGHKLNRLANKEGLALLEQVTGVDPEAAFGEARARLLSALDAWDDLPERASNATWKLLSRVTDAGEVREPATKLLAVVASGSEQQRRKALAELFASRGFDTSALGEFLNGVAVNGLLALLDDIELPDIAARVKRLIDGSEPGAAVERLQQYIERAFKLEQLRGRVTKTSFKQLNGWFVERLSLLFEEKFDFSRLDEARSAINAVITMREKVYSRIDSALNRNYEMSLAATWQQTTLKDALLDAVFDTKFPGARKRLKEVLAEANYDNLLTKPTEGVELRNAVLSHAIERQSSIAVNLPYFSSKTMRFNKSVAKVEATDDGGRVLVYSLEGKDEIWRVGKFRSSVAVDAAVSLRAPRVRNHSGAGGGSWNYSYRYARKDMRSREVEELLRPFIDVYYPGHFPEGPSTSLAQWVQDMDREIEARIGRQTATLETFFSVTKWPSRAMSSAPG